MKHLIPTLIFLFLSSNIYAQQISSDRYNKQLIYEDFNEETKNFSIVTNTDNYFIIDKGDYLLSRNNNVSEYAMIANDSQVNNFILKTSFRIGPGDNKQSSLGIILKAQKEGKGAIIFEINKKKEYRIKQLENNKYKILSGTNKNDGWVKNPAINTVDEHNAIEIRSENNIYDVYTNNKYITTFFIPDYINGSCGLIISPETKARVSYYYIYTKGENNTNVASFTKNNNDNINSTIEDLNRKIISLEKNNEKLNNINIEIKNRKDSLIQKLNDEKDMLSKEANLLNQEINLINKTNTDLSNEIKTIRAKNTSTKNKISQIKQELSLKTSVNIDLEKETKSLKANNKNIKNEISQLKQKLSLKSSINIDLEKETKNLKTTNNKNKKKISQLKQEVSLKSSINTDLEQEIKTLKSKQNKLLSNNSQLTKDLEKEKKISSISNKKVNTLKQELSLSSSINNEISKKSKQYEIEIEELKNNFDLKRLNSELTKANNELKALITLKEDNIKLIDNLKQELSDLKDLFIKKDFELNGVSVSEIKKTKAPVVSANSKLKSNTKLYSVQLGVFMQEQKSNFTNVVQDIWYNTTKLGTYIYYSGEFNSLKEATNRRNELINNGFNNASIVTLNK